MSDVTEEVIGGAAGNGDCWRGEAAQDPHFQTSWCEGDEIRGDVGEFIMRYSAIEDMISLFCDGALCYELLVSNGGE